MNELYIFVCENFYIEYKKIIEIEGISDVVIVNYTSVCRDKTKKDEIVEKIENIIRAGNHAILFCSRNCILMKDIKEQKNLTIHTSEFCFNKLVNDDIFNYIVSKGGYVISSGWLDNWRQNIESQGFDKDKAKEFYNEFCTELVYLDAGTLDDSEKKMMELSDFLGIPYITIPVELEPLRLMILNEIYAWRLQKNKREHVKSISKAQRQCAEYAAIVDLMAKISTFTARRDVIGKIKEIFTLVFGIEYFKFWRSEIDDKNMPEDVKELIDDGEREYFFSSEDKRFCIKIRWNEKIYGAVDVWGFLFPEYFEKYLNFAVEIGKICGVVFSNIEQYEKVLNSEQELRYISYHDSMTGLYNRSYLNNFIIEEKREIHEGGANEACFADKVQTVFAFDIDGLKFVNDHYGHNEGDTLIIRAGEILKKSFRETDIVARVGGDEFVAIIAESQIPVALCVKERIENEIALQNERIDNPDLKVRISIGFAIKGNSLESLESLMQKADAIMYADKNSRKRIT